MVWENTQHYKTVINSYLNFIFVAISSIIIHFCLAATYDEVIYPEVLKLLYNIIKKIWNKPSKITISYDQIKYIIFKILALLFQIFPSNNHVTNNLGEKKL